MKKRIIALVLAAIILILCAACSDTSTDNNESTPPNTTPAVGDSAILTPTLEDMDDSTVPTAEFVNVVKPDNLYQGEILCGGFPAFMIFQAPLEDIIETIGEPEYQDEFSVVYGDITLYLYDENVSNIQVTDSSVVEIDGVALNKNRDGLAGLLGEPSSEGDEGYGYSVIYDYPNYSAVFELGIPEEPAWRVQIFPGLTEERAQAYVTEWLEYNPFEFEVDVEAVTVDGVSNDDFYAFAVYYIFPDEVGLFTNICVNKKSGAMFNFDPYSDKDVEPLNVWYYNYHNPPAEEPPANIGGNVSADGYVIGSGSTVYIKGGGYSLMGSITEGQINFKADGGWTIIWVAVHESMGFSGWQRSALYNNFGTRFYSPNVQQEVRFIAPNNVSLNRLYIDASKAK